jgi:trans-aconitate methyltransferase
MDEAIARRVAELGPWITRFRFLGKTYGGDYDAVTDPRIVRVPRALGPARCARILELGCLEGGHTVALAHAYPQAEIVAVDVRPENLARAEFLTALLGCRSPRFVPADLETADLGALGPFDLIVCIGLLYHLWEPWKLLRQLGAQGEHLWLWTVYCPDAEAQTEHGGYRGRDFVEGPLEHPLSAVRATSFFPTLGSLLAMVQAAGFARQDVWELGSTPNGPSVLLHARRTA